MFDRRFVMGLAIVSTVGLLHPPDADAQRPTRTRRPNLQARRTIPLASAPVVTNWSPKEKAYPGQTITIEGRNFDPDGVAVHLRDRTSVKLPTVAVKPTRIVVRVGTSHYTTGATLQVSQPGHEPRVLDRDYQVLSREARFSGPSLWHLTESDRSDVFTRGRVQLRLDMFEFADEGTGTYTETVDLIRRVDTRSEACSGNLGIRGRRTVEVYDFETQRVRRGIRWRRLADDRIELEGIGLSVGRNGPQTGLATVAGSSLQLPYETLAAGMWSEPHEKKGDCSSEYLKSPYVPPLVGVPFRTVEWVLQRRDAH